MAASTASSHSGVGGLPSYYSSRRYLWAVVFVSLAVTGIAPVPPSVPPSKRAAWNSKSLRFLEAPSYLEWDPDSGERDDSLAASSIAVCVTGQTGRMLPTQLSPFFKDNPAYNYTLFYSLQTNDAGGATYADSNPQINGTGTYSSMNESELADELRKVYSGYPHVAVGEVKLSKPKSLDQWTSDMGGHALDRIWQYTKYEDHVLNMYSHQTDCTPMIAKYEAAASHPPFDYVIHSREDVIFFKPLPLAKLLPGIRRSEGSRAQCDYLTKNCLRWAGINMRFAVMSRDAAFKLLPSKISFYRSMYDRNATIFNPEQFEVLCTAAQNLTACGVSVELFPVTAGRSVGGGDYCLIAPEAYCYKCYPKGMDEFMSSKHCKRGLRKVGQDLSLDDLHDLL